MSKKILIIDDNRDLLSLMGSLLEENYELNLQGSGENVELCLNEFRPDLIMLDIGLPYKSGYEICTEIKSISEFSNIPIIFVTAMSGTSARTMGYKLGAINFIEKPFSNSELIAVVASVLSKNTVQQNDIVSLDGLVLDMPKREVRLGHVKVKLTKSELKILSLLMKYPGRVFSREYMYEHIGRKNENSSLRIVDTHISSIRKKLGESHMSIESIYGEGYFLAHKNQ